MIGILICICERCWIAEKDGKVVGSIFVVRHDEKTAKLRMLYVDASARGLGIGNRLIEEEPMHSFGKDLVSETWMRDL